MSLAADYVQTPTYISPYRPMSRSNEIGQGNTEWMKMLHRVDLIPPTGGSQAKATVPVQEVAARATKPEPPTKPSSQYNPHAVPPKVTFNVPDVPSNPHTIPSKSDVVPSSEYVLSNSHTAPPPRFEQVPGAKLPLIHTAAVPPKPLPTAPFRPFKDEYRTDEYYRKYLQLSGNMAYRYPEPGYPRERQGGIGGTWRHIKQVNGYTGSQVCFVDGMVRLCDREMRDQPAAMPPHMRGTMATPAYAANRHNVSSYRQTLRKEFERSQYHPWQQDKVLGSSAVTSSLPQIPGARP